MSKHYSDQEMERRYRKAKFSSKFVRGNMSKSRRSVGHRRARRLIAQQVDDMVTEGDLREIDLECRFREIDLFS